MTLLEWRKKIEEALAGFENPSLEAKWLIEEALQKKLTLDANYNPTPQESVRLLEWLNRRLTSEPLSRIKGMREFWSLPFYINEHTLDPRPETEHIVEGVLDWIKEQPKGCHPRESGDPGKKTLSEGKKEFYLASQEVVALDPRFREDDARGMAGRFDLRGQDAPWRILDLGTGSGCILISLLHELKNATGIGIDLSLEAIEVACSNAVLNKVNERVTFTKGNWGSDLTELFDVIVSNPPYIPLAEKLPTSVRDFDPASALFAGNDGLDSYRLLAPEFKRLLSPEGLGVLEFGEGQRKAVESIFTNVGFKVAFVLKDLAGIERVIGFTH